MITINVKLNYNCILLHLFGNFEYIVFEKNNDLVYLGMPYPCKSPRLLKYFVLKQMNLTLLKKSHIKMMEKTVSFY